MVASLAVETSDHRRCRAMIRLATTVLFATALFAPALAAPPPAGDPAPGTPPADFRLDGDLEKGRAIFARSCALCHGEKGDGHGLVFMDPPPRDLRNRAGMVSANDWDVYRVIRDGGQALGLSPKMLPWGGRLTAAELLDVATFVRSLGAPPADMETPRGAAPQRAPHGIDEQAHPITASTGDPGGRIPPDR